MAAIQFDGLPTDWQVRPRQPQFMLPLIMCLPRQPALLCIHGYVTSREREVMAFERTCGACARSSAQVRAAERRLRGALLLDGLEPAEGWLLARYNDPFTPLPLRRNEVLITLPDGFVF